MNEEWVNQTVAELQAALPAYADRALLAQLQVVLAEQQHRLDLAAAELMAGRGANGIGKAKPSRPTGWRSQRMTKKLKGCKRKSFIFPLQS